MGGIQVFGSGDLRVQRMGSGAMRFAAWGICSQIHYGVWKKSCAVVDLAKDPIHACPHRNNHMRSFARVGGWVKSLVGTRLTPRVRGGRAWRLALRNYSRRAEEHDF
jgi:hypothetical protein